MTVRRLHRLIGITLLLPFLGWAVTGFVFFIKPGYGSAYEALSVKTYPLDQPLAVQGQSGWLEVRVVKTILGTHLLVRTTEGWRHLQPETFAPAADITEAQLRTLVTDALTAHPDRYGTVTRVSGNTVETSTGARVTLDWNRLALQQRGHDTDRIDALYRVHYLQWTGLPAVDKVLGLVGLSLLIALTALGARLAFRP
jgi:hypothetical protein